MPHMYGPSLSGFLLVFMHTLGEFGVILMIGGNIPGKTRVLSVALYEKVESFQYNQAHFYAFILLISCFTLALIQKKVVQKYVSHF